MDIQTVKEFGFWGAIAVGTGGLLFGIAKSISDAAVEIYKKRNESQIKIQEHSALNENKHFTLLKDKEIDNLHEQNKILHDSIEELKLMQETMKEEYEAQIEELREQINRFERLLHEKDTVIKALETASKSRVSDIETLKNSRFFLKIEQMIHDVTLSEHAQTDVFRYIANKFVVIRTRVNKFLELFQGWDGTPERLEREITEFIKNRTEEYQKWARANNISSNVIRLFEHYHNKRTAELLQKNTTIIYSRLYINNYERMDAMLSAWIDVFRRSLDDAYIVVEHVKKQKPAHFDEELYNIIKGLELDNV